MRLAQDEGDARHSLNARYISTRTIRRLVIIARARIRYVVVAVLSLEFAASLALLDGHRSREGNVVWTRARERIHARYVEALGQPWYVHVVDAKIQLFNVGEASNAVVHRGELMYSYARGSVTSLGLKLAVGTHHCEGVGVSAISRACTQHTSEHSLGKVTAKKVAATVP